MAEMWRCPKCNAVVSVNQPFCGNCKTPKDSVLEPEGDDSQPTKEIILSTGDIKREYKILSIVFAAGIQKFGGKGLFSSDAKFISDKQYNEMIHQVYASAIRTFKQNAIAVGADAIIHCNFDIEQIELREEGLVSSGNALRIQVFCTGTAVQLM